MDDLRRLMDFDSLWTLWFWITHVMAWSLTSHFTMGVPFDMVVQANREQNKNGPWTTHCDAMIRASIFRLNAVFDRFGTAIVATWSFLIASLATSGVFFQIEFALALVTLLGPLTIIFSLTTWQARRMGAADLSPAGLRDGVRRLRFWNQVCGVVGIVLAATAAVWNIARTVTPI
ncbi:MAG: hypothetical protein AAF281_11895 [Pseudomonadota bacterium]